jgi:HPt (histidine-containing phosphotransfer) domain-containing protein
MDMTRSLIDLSNFRQMTGGDPQFLIDILEMIDQQAPAAMTQMQDHLQQGQFEDLARAAHKLRSTLHVLGNAEWVSMLKEIEMYAKEAGETKAPTQVAAANSLLMQFEQAHAQMLRAIVVELAQLRKEIA